MPELHSFQHVLITGASSGIGRALALRYAMAGVLLSLSGRNEERLLATVEECRAKGAEVHFKLVSVTEQEEMREWVLGCDALKPIDLVIANAGVSGGTGNPLENGEHPEFGENDVQVRQIFDVNVSGVFNTILPVIPLMVSRSRGNVAVVSSLAGYRGWPGAPAYCASKAAVRVYVQALHGYLKDTGVKVHAICPGFVRSRMTDVNEFSMPGIVEADKAAGIIARGIAKGKFLIAFPLMAYLSVVFVACLPQTLANMILTRMPAKTKL